MPCPNHHRRITVVISAEDLADIEELPAGGYPPREYGRSWRSPSGHEIPSWRIGMYVRCACLEENQIGIAWAWAVTAERGLHLVEAVR